VGLEDRIFVFGDIHGCVDELKLLFSYLILYKKLSKEDKLCFIGDYIDRGLYTRETIDALIQIKETFPKARFLKGNHEAMLLDYLGIEAFPNTFVYLKNSVGGQNTLRSYGIINIPFDKRKGKECLPFFPEPHLEFLTSLDNYKKTENYIFVHAGVNPLIADMRLQNPNEMMRMKGSSLKTPHLFPQVVVHGHEAVTEAVFNVKTRMINIDTDVVHGGKLTCLELPSMDIYQIGLNSSEIMVDKLVHV